MLKAPFYIKGDKMKSTLLDTINALHTTALGEERIRRNLSLETEDVVAWCQAKILLPDCQITRQGKNWYASIEGCTITVNAHSLTIITAHPHTKTK